MMRTTKLLALVAVAVVAVACGGMSPTSPAASVSSDDATALAGAKAAEGPVPSLACRGISEVRMLLLPSLADPKVEATYLKRGQPSKCRVAPKWDSRPLGRLIRTDDPFVMKVTRTNPLTDVQVSAEAPNGVRGTITVK